MKRVRSLDFTTIAHRRHRILTPIFPEKMERLLEALGVADGMRVLDVGCGKGAFLLRCAERAAIHGLGCDLNSAFLDEARMLAAASPREGNLEFVLVKAEKLAIEDHSYDVGICTGATHALGSLAKTLAFFARALRPGGACLIGEGYWKRKPDPRYLEFLGGFEEEICDLPGTAALAESAGWTVESVAVSSEDEWDAYEGLYRANVLAYCADHPEDPKSPEHLNRINAWFDAYLNWGRDALGLAWLVLRAPIETADVPPPDSSETAAPNPIQNGIL